MATNFPASLDTLTNPTSSDSLSSPSHSAQHANANDAIEALQAKVGVDSSAVTSSLDYKVAQLEAEPSANEIAIFNETQSSGTQGGAGTTGSYAKRTLNTTVVNNISGCSIASSVITLSAGTYQVMAYSPTYRVDRGKSRLYDTTNSAVLAMGGTGLASQGGYGTFISVIATQFTLAGSTNIELQTRVQINTGTQDLGLAAGFGDDEIYSQIMIRRIA